MQAERAFLYVLLIFTQSAPLLVTKEGESNTKPSHFPQTSSVPSRSARHRLQAAHTEVANVPYGGYRLKAVIMARPPVSPLRPSSLRAKGANKSAEMLEDAQDYTYSSLNRLRRDRLLSLCQKQDILHAKDATRAVLIDALLEYHQEENPQECVPDVRDYSHIRDRFVFRPIQPTTSASSTSTARPESSVSGRSSSSRSRKSGRKLRKGSNVTLSDRPLLLRSRSIERHLISKPITPIPSPILDEDLSGLDLESLQLVDKEIPYAKLEKLDKIGSGGFKDVYVGKYQITKKTRKRVAIADIRDQLSEMDIKELTLLRDLSHENIVRFIGVCIPPAELRLTPCMIVSELCANGDLFDYIRNTSPPRDDEIFRIMLETARGLEYLHLRTPAIIHRDVKSTNVLITRNKTAKINDFGLARVRHNKRGTIKSLVGTVNWQAVELWTPKPNYDEKVDVWSAAMTFWETLQWHQPEKKYPFQDMNEHQIYLDVGQKNLRPPTVSIRRHYGAEIVELLNRMWDGNPKLRPTMSEVCKELEKLVAMKRESIPPEYAAPSTRRSPIVTRNASR